VSKAGLFSVKEWSTSFGLRPKPDELVENYYSLTSERRSVSDETTPPTEDVTPANWADPTDVDVLTPEELPAEDRTFIPNKERGGTTVLAKESAAGEAEGFFIFLASQPVFLPTDIAEGLANFILNK
jgi:hypothetical protein